MNPNSFLPGRWKTAGTSRSANPSGDSEKATSHQLLSRIAQQDEAALRELYSLYALRIFRFVRVRLRDDHAAEAVMIDTLYEVWKQPHKFRGESQLSTWLLGIAKYKMLKEIRQMNRRSSEDSDGLSDGLTDPHIDVSEAYDAREASQILRACIEKLSDSHRELVQLVYIEGMSMAEIARMQNIPEGTVRSRLHCARKVLKKRFRQRSGSRS